MLHPAFGQALATARIEDLHRAAARGQALHLALRVADEPDKGGHGDRDAGIRVGSAAGRRDGMTPAEMPRAEGIRSS